MTKKSDKKKDVTKEVLKEEEKWYGLEKKFWTVVEFGVYTILLTFTAVAVGIHYKTLTSDKNVIIDEGSKLIVDEKSDGVMYYVSDICTENTCDTTLTAQYNGKDIKIEYSSDENGTTLAVGDTKIEDVNPLQQFALVSNGYIATVQADEGKSSIVKYYDKEGNSVHSYTTYLDITNDLTDTKGVYGTCTKNEDKDKLEIVKYEISEEGLFTENTIGSFEDANCQD